MAVLRSPVFIICISLFIVHQIVQKGLEISFPLFDRYLDNLLAMPVILTLLLAERQWLFKKGSSYKLPVLDITIATIYIIIITEVIFPLLSKNFITDWRDIIFYILGSVIFHLTINKSTQQADGSRTPE